MTLFLSKTFGNTFFFSKVIILRWNFKLMFWVSAGRKWQCKFWNICCLLNGQRYESRSWASHGPRQTLSLFARNRWRLSTDRMRWQQFPLFSLPRKRPSVPLRCRLGALNPASRKNIFQNFGLVIRRMFHRGSRVMIGSCSWAGETIFVIICEETELQSRRCLLITTAVRNINFWICISELRQSFAFPTTPWYPST